MRGSLLVLALVAACSDSSGPRHVPTLTTQLSSFVDSLHDGSVVVTLNAANPTDTTIHLSFTTPIVAQIKINGVWSDGTNTFTPGYTTDTLSLTPGANAPLGTTSVLFFTPPFIAEPFQQFTLSPGTYSLRACYGMTQLVCGNAASFTVVQ